MNKFLTLVFLLPLLTIAQKKEAVYKKLANVTCECAGKKDPATITETDLGICIFESLDKLNDKEKKVIGYNPDKKMETISVVAESVGIEMAITCPQVFSKLNSTEEPPLVEMDDLTAIGTLESITSNEFKMIHLLDESNEPKQFIWLFSFEGDALFIKNKVVKGDKLEIHYREQEIFDPKTNSYRKYNEITEIKLL